MIDTQSLIGMRFGDLEVIAFSHYITTDPIGYVSVNVVGMKK